MRGSLTLFDGITAKWPFGDTNGLEAYLNQVWRHRPLFLSEEDDEERIRSTEQRFFGFSDETIHPKNYIGFVQYGDLRLNIYPRAFYNHPQIDVFADPFPAIHHVLKWLNYSSRIHFPFSEVPLHLQSQDDWLEALIYLFANYTLEVLSNSPHFAYQEVTEEMAFVRGRIAMQPYIQHNLAKGKHHLMHCTYEPFLYDNQFNRIVKYTCRLLQTATLNGHNRYLLDEIVFLLDEVSDIPCSAEDCAKVPVNRLYPEIGVISNMCAAFLSNQAYADGTSNNKNLCILLPMEVIYEQYIAGFIRQHFPELKPRAQASDEYVALTGEGFTRPVFRMRHDILIPGKLIIDTKYKFRNILDDGKGGVSQDDIYQMTTYCYKRRVHDGLLLYPVHFGGKAENRSGQFKVNELLIRVESIDITETDLADFDEKQRVKMERVLGSLQ